MASSSSSWRRLMRTAGALPALLFLAGLPTGCFPIYLSPLSFSPDGRHLAMTDICHQDDSNPPGADDTKPVFRLLVISDRKTVQVVEKTQAGCLLSPVFSPDGTVLCHLRLAAPSEPNEAAGRATGDGNAATAASTSSSASQAAGSALDLVVRDARTFAIRSVIPIPMADDESESPAPADSQPSKADGNAGPPPDIRLGRGALFPPLQFLEGGRGILVCLKERVFLIDLSRQAVQVFAERAHAARVSADGSMVATLYMERGGEGTLRFYHADGTPAGRRVLDPAYACDVGDFAWKDNHDLIFLRVRNNPGSDAHAGAPRK